MSLSPEAIPQLIIQLVDIRNGTDNTITQNINQNLTIYVLESPDFPEIASLQGFIQTNGSPNNQVHQNLNQNLANFPLFPNYYTLEYQQVNPQNVDLDFAKFINNDQSLRTLFHDNQRVVIEGNENVVDLFSEQIIYDLSWYDKLRANPDYFKNQNISFESFLNEFVGEYLGDSLQVALQDVLINDGDNNQISTTINQTLSTFLVLDDHFNFAFNNYSNLEPIQFSFQENFSQTANNIIKQNINQNIHFDFTFARTDFNQLNNSIGFKIIEPKFDIDNFVNPILDNQVPNADLYQNHQIEANLKNLQITDILGDQNTDSKSTSLITILTKDARVNSENDISLNQLINQVQTLVLTGDETELTQEHLTNLFDQIIDNNSIFRVVPPIINEGYAEFVITRSGNLSRYVKLEYITENGLAKAGINYLPTVGQVIFTPNQVSKTIRVPIIDSAEFNLVTKVINYSSQPLLGEFNIYADTNNREITLWNYARDVAGESLTEGYLNFAVKTTEKNIDVKLFLDGVNNFNSYLAFNNQLEKAQEFINNGFQGARFFKNKGIRLRLTNGSDTDLKPLDNNLIAHQGFLARTTPGLLTQNEQIFFVPTHADGRLQARLINSPDGDNYEVGLIRVDNLNGRVGRFNPGDLGYQKAAMKRKIVLFKNQNPAATAREGFTNPEVLREGENTFLGNLKQVRLKGNSYYSLYLDKEGEITFSVEQPLDIIDEGRGYHHLSFNDQLTLELTSNVLVTPGVFNQPVTVNISQATSSHNLVALFQVDAFDGGIDLNGDNLIDTRPGDKNYHKIVLERAKDPLTGIILTKPDSFLGTTSQKIALAENSIYGLVLIPDATIDAVLNNSPVALFSFAEANPNRISHLARLGANLFGFEDRVGDLDYNDTILEFQFS